MNKLAIITAFLGGVKNRYMQYHPDRQLEEKFRLASQTDQINGLELCYPADFNDLAVLKSHLDTYGFGVSSINVRSRRQGRWLRGAFSSESQQERREVIDDFKKAIDFACELGTNRVSTCPLNDGHDYPFEMYYPDAYAYAEETFTQICRYNRQIKLCIEYKWNDPRTRCLFGNAGETLCFCNRVGLDNLGVTMDFGHAIQAGERPAQTAALLHRHNRLFYVHVNDNDRNWDWDMLPGAYHLIELIEFFFYLKEIGYTDDWYAYDVMSKEIDPVKHFTLVAKLTRKAEALADKIDRPKMKQLMAQRDPNRSLEYLHDIVFP